MLTGTGALSAALCVHLDGRYADHPLDYDSGIIPDRNSWNRPLHQLLHGQSTHVRRATELQKLTDFPRRYV